MLDGRVQGAECIETCTVAENLHFADHFVQTGKVSAEVAQTENLIERAATMDELLGEMTSKYRWSIETFELTARAKFRCEYCGRDILETFDLYRFSQTDHLLPRSRYPQLLKEETNLVVACHSCNNLKSTWDPNSKEPIVAKDVKKLAEAERATLISRTKTHLEELRRAKGEEFEAMRKLIRVHFPAT